MTLVTPHRAESVYMTSHRVTELVTEVEKTGVPVGTLIEFSCIEDKVFNPSQSSSLDPDGNGLYGVVCQSDGTFGVPFWPAESQCILYPVCSRLPRLEDTEEFGYAVPHGAKEEFDPDTDAPIYITKVFPGNSLYLTCSDPTAIFDNGVGSVMEFKCPEWR